MTVRAVYNWALWLANIARGGGKPWDQTTFAGAIESVSTEVTLRHLNMVGRGEVVHAELWQGRVGKGLLPWVRGREGSRDEVADRARAESRQQPSSRKTPARNT
jgi:hypothetical protein